MNDELAFQKWMADGHPGVLTPPSTPETEFRRLFGVVALTQALRQGQIGPREYAERVRELYPGNDESDFRELFEDDDEIPI